MIRLDKSRWLWIALIGLLLLFRPAWIYAQANVRLRVSKPDITQFPQISFSLSITDESGRHISGLSPSNFSLIEDGQTLAISSLDEVSVGTRQIFIINSSRGLRGRDALGFTRFDYVREALTEWWARLDAATVGTDDLNLTTLDGDLVLHSSLAAELSAALSAYEPSFEAEFASFDPLLQSLQLSNDNLSMARMPTLIFFITPLITEAQDLPLANTITWATDNDITIYPILVGPPEILEFPEMDNFQLLADATGGELIFFDANEGLNALADRILTRRMLYDLSYTSKANSTGSHNLQVRVTSDNLDAISDPSSFSINISAPELIILQMPDRIVRETENPDLSLEAIQPTSASLQFLVAFPDGYPRDIVSSQLFIDNQLVEIRTQPPFDVFEWDISGYQETASHDIKIMVEDSLGLQGSATGMPVTVEVIIPETTLTSFRPDVEILLPVGGGLALLLIISAAAIIVVRRRGTKTPSPDTRRKSTPSRSIGLRRKSDEALIEATLIPTTPDMPSISLIGMDLVLGRDASISAARLDDPSVNALHARVIRLASGDYLIRDQGSVAGTWVNYQQVPERGSILRHGDVIHLGRVKFKFQRRNPPPESRIHVESINPDSPESNLNNRGSQETPL
jgi:hypothetical protein